MASVIKLTVEIGGKRGNNGHLYTWEVERGRERNRRENGETVNRALPMSATGRRGPRRRAHGASGSRTTSMRARGSDKRGPHVRHLWPCAQRKWTHCVSGFRGGHPGKRDCSESAGAQREGRGRREPRRASVPERGAWVLVIEADSRRNHGLETPSRGQPGRDRTVIASSWTRVNEPLNDRLDKARGDQASQYQGSVTFCSPYCTPSVSRIIFFLHTS